MSIIFDVRFALLGADDSPVTNEPVRLVLGQEPGWNAAGAGTKFVTDAKGEYRFEITGPLEVRRRKLPTNFFTQLVSSAQETRHLTVAAELPYSGRSWLYVSEVDCFPDGTSVRTDAMRVFGVDARGHFTEPTTTSGHGIARFFLKPDEREGSAKWTVHLTVKRHPEPVRR